MTTSDNQHTMLWIDEDYDREDASDRDSRYGAYLRQRGAEFLEDGTLVDDAGEFAQAAFTIACSPIMSPGYVRTHRRVRETSWRWDDDRRAAVELSLVAPLPTVVAEVLGGWEWQGWRSHGWGENRRWVEPYDNDRPGAFTTLTLRVPLDLFALPDASYDGRHADVAAAKTAVGVVCRQVNAGGGAVLAALEGVAR